MVFVVDLEIKYVVAVDDCETFACKVIVKSSFLLKLNLWLCSIFISDSKPLKSIPGKLPLNNVFSEKLTFLYLIKLK